MKIEEFNNTFLQSHKNVEKLAKKLINESANAVLLEMFDDKCILADHLTGQIFEASYDFNGREFVFENFDLVRLEKSDEGLREAISDYLDDADISLPEAYRAISSKSNVDLFEDSLTEALASKNLEVVTKYNELVGINEELSSLKKTDVFKDYTSYINESPMDNIKMFDWKNPVVVSLIDEDKNKFLNKSMKIKAKKLKSSAEFKRDLIEAASLALDGNMNLLESLISNNVSLVSLDTAGLKETIGLSVVGNKTLMENRNKIVEHIQTIIENDEYLSDKKAEATSEPDSDDKAPEASEQDVEAIKKALETAKEKAKDEKLIDKIETLINSLDTAKDAGETDVEAVKESIVLLSL